MDGVSRVALIDDDAVVRRECAAVIGEAGFACESYQTAEAAIAAARAGQLASIVLIDLDLPGESSFAAMATLRRVAPAARLIALTAHGGDDWLFPALSAGCLGYVLKAEAVHRLGDVLREVQSGGAPLSPDVARRVVTSFHSTRSEESSLSERELQALRYLADGWTYAQVALQLELSLASVRTYVLRAYAKLGVHTKSEATAKLARLGLLR